MRFLFAFALAVSIAQQQPPKPQPLPPATQIGTVGKPAVQGPYEFTSDIGVFLIVVRADKAVAFDAAMAKLKLAFAATTASNERKRQASGWRVLKSTELAAPVVVTPPAASAIPGAAPAVVPTAPVAPVGPPTIAYLFLIEPVSKKSSYDWIEILRELSPNEVQPTYDQLKGAIVSATRIGLTELLKMGGGA